MYALLPGIVRGLKNRASAMLVDCLYSEEASKRQRVTVDCFAVIGHRTRTRESVFGQAGTQH